jgi:hypothetical protein
MRLARRASFDHPDLFPPLGDGAIPSRRAICRKP